MNNDNDLNLHSMTKFSGWLCYCVECWIILYIMYKNTIKEELQSVLPTSSTHNKGGLPNINIVQLFHIFLIFLNWNAGSY